MKTVEQLIDDALVREPHKKSGKFSPSLFGRWYLKGIGRAWCIYPKNWNDYKKVGDIHPTPELLGEKG